MATTRSLSTAPSPPPRTLTATGARHRRHRLRAVDRDEVVDVADFLPPGATWLPAPQHTLPTLPGRPPMVGYLVLVPADQQPRPAGRGAGPHRRRPRRPAPAGAATRSCGSTPCSAPPRWTAGSST